MIHRRWIYLALSFIFLIAIGYFAFQRLDFSYAYTPDKNRIVQQGVYSVQHQSLSSPAYDLWGTYYSPQEANQVLQTSKGRKTLSPENGAVRIDRALFNLGRKAFYEETFGNEMFLTDILGMLDGALTLPNISKAILALKGEGTTNLQVELAEDITLGEQVLKKGEKVDTGLDVPKGAMTPLGMPVSISEGRVRVGISCAACHATVAPDTKEVVEGAPNLDLNAGLLLALASNSAAYFTNTDIENLEQYIKDVDRTVTASDGTEKALPDPVALEKAVDETLVKWPKGSFDSTHDLESNPSQIPDSFTWMDHPYGWSGFASVGPFHGLSSLNNNVHAQNSDILAQSEQSQDLFQIDREVFIATILQNAAHPQFRFNPHSDRRPSDFFSSVDPNPETPGVNEMVLPPTFPKVSVYTPNGAIIGSEGYHVGEQINAMSAWQNSLRPPQPPIDMDVEKVNKGREVFERAGCVTCHAGDYFSNHRIIPVEEIKTEGSRAKAFKDTEPHMVQPYTYPPNTPIPVPEGTKPLRVPTEQRDEEQLKLALAHDGTNGGYKVKNLIGLYWTPPYLHDGGVAVGENLQSDFGLPHTLLKGQMPDPKNSLFAVIDRETREKVIAANQQEKSLQDVHVTGEGHEYWVDKQSGFTSEEQEALVHYLLTQTSQAR